MANKRKQAVMQKVFFNAVLLFLILDDVNSYDMQCRSKNICGKSSLCCESSVSKQWCCARTKRCCSNGCCPIDTTINKLLQYSPSYHPDKRKNALPDTKSIVDSIFIFNRQYNLTKTKQSESKMCDDKGLFYCGYNETCCNVGESWMCCPYNDGTCCSGQNYCCPSMTTCDTSKSTRCKHLEKSSKYAEGKTLISAAEDKTATSFILCPDDEMICPDTDTCCLVSESGYGCCPYDEAVCCSDHLHCCPSDTECNTEMLTCDPLKTNSEKGFRSLPIRTINEANKMMKINLLEKKFIKNNI